MRLVAARPEATQSAFPPPLPPSFHLPSLCRSAVAPLPHLRTQFVLCLAAIAQAQMLQVKVDLYVACLTNVRRQRKEWGVWRSRGVVEGRVKEAGWVNWYLQFELLTGTKLPRLQNKC